MLARFLNSILGYPDVTSADAFDVTKKISDYVGILTRLAFLNLLHRLLWVMWDTGAFGNKDEWFRSVIVNLTSFCLWILSGIFAISFINLTCRIAVEIFDSLTGFESNNIKGIFGILMMLLRLLLGITIGIYVGLALIAVSSASYKLGDYVAKQQIMQSKTDSSSN